MKTHRTATLIAGATALALAGSANAAELLALYEFDEADAASFADSTGNTTPTIIGGVIADPAEGRDGTGAASFDGLDIGLTIPVDINPSVLPNATIGAWVKLNSFSVGVHNAPWGHDDGGWDRGRSAGFRGLREQLAWRSFGETRGW